MRCSLVQFSPQGFGLPVVQLLLQLAIKAPKICRVEVQLPAELGKVLLHVLTGLGLDEEVEGGVGRVTGVLARHGGGGAVEELLLSPPSWLTVEEGVRASF